MLRFSKNRPNLFKYHFVSKSPNGCYFDFHNVAVLQVILGSLEKADAWWRTGHYYCAGWQGGSYSSSGYFQGVIQTGLSRLTLREEADQSFWSMY